MLGHRLTSSLAARYSVSGTVRTITPALDALAKKSGATLIAGVEAEDSAQLETTFDKVKPDVVINCIGVVKQLQSANSPLIAIPLNSVLPHQLAQLAAQRGARFIHFSTDCVFAGDAGPYSEVSAPDARDLYGRSKLLGEVNSANALTLRTSIIGHELITPTGLLEWILSNRGKSVSGFARALYTGVTTNYMATALVRLIDEFPRLRGVWHLSADPISKFDLIELVDEIYDLGIQVTRDEYFVCDRRLDSTPLRQKTGIVPPSWHDMIAAMRTEHGAVN
jgi:dTDP-4-dehydrorhamnose reductase